MTAGGVKRMRRFLSVMLVAFSFVVSVPAVYAQSGHAAPQSAIDAALQQRVDATAADRQEVTRALESREVKEVAGHWGVNLLKPKTASPTLAAERLPQVAARPGLDSQ